MNKYFKEFCHRGLLFGGFGPIIMGIIFAILDNTLTDFYLTGIQLLLGIVSTYLLAFLQAGASVFNQIEEWPLAKSLFCHFFTIYLAYSSCYILNSWIPFEPAVLIIFTLIFIAVYFAIWLTVYLIVKSTSRKFNLKLN